MVVVWGQKRRLSRPPAAWLRRFAAFRPPRPAGWSIILHMGMTIVSQRQTWWWTAALWSCAALFYATETVFGMRAEGMRHAWSLLFLTDFLHWLPWALATPIVLQLGRRPPPRTKKRWTVWLMHAAVVTVIQAISSAWRAGMLVLLNPYANPGRPGQFQTLWFSSFYSGLFGAMLLYAMIVAAGHILEDRQRLARQEMEALFDTHIFLDLHVKVETAWREKASFLNSVDWRTMAGRDET